MVFRVQYFSEVFLLILLPGTAQFALEMFNSKLLDKLFIEIGKFTIRQLIPVPEIIDPVFAKTSQNARFLLSENERFGLVFVKTGSINSGTDFSAAPVCFKFYKTIELDLRCC